MKPLTKREHGVLRYAVVYSSVIEYDQRGRARWDGDCMAPFQAHGTLNGLIAKGLMEKLSNGAYGFSARATAAGRNYQCRAQGCSRGGLYVEGEDGRDHETGKCPVCAGSGLLTLPNEQPARADSRHADQS